MFFPGIALPFQTMLLSMEAHSVVGLRLTKLASGGSAAMNEACGMISEKFVALAEATGTLMTGGSLDTVIARYRAIVRANELRLQGNKATRETPTRL